MENLTLVILAAGMGSRYGGLKQIDPIGPNGEIILELSVYDAMKAGFKKVIFIIKKEMEEVFQQAIGNKLAKHIEVSYVYQDISMIPSEFTLENFQGRQKPWGTAHALACCSAQVNDSFAVINADDYYGQESFQKMHDFLVSEQQENAYCMMGYKLGNTLTANGSVARGICNVVDGNLVSVVERTKIEIREDGVAYFEDETWFPLHKDSLVSMNMWGFHPLFIEQIKERFPIFLQQAYEKNPLTAEFYIPQVVDALIKEEKATVKMIESNDKWYGVTYQNDKPMVKAGIQSLIEKGLYPKKLWGE